jgi:hypothetical protein
MATHKPNEKRLALLERRKNVAARYLRGQTQWEIARAFGLNQSTISDDLKAIHREWLAQAVEDRDTWIARELARLDECERQAWQAWSKSQENSETLRARLRGNQAETEKISRGQAGDPRFLDLVLKCVHMRAVILGLEKPAPGDPVPVQVKLVRADDFYNNADRLPVQGA